MKTILICGATGFIGRNLLEYYIKQNKYNINSHLEIFPVDAFNTNYPWNSNFV